ncbi:MAG TPA: ThuA domain-containing protein [Ruminiclostridium sp.]
MPIAYTKKWGKGRVFYTSLGHHADVFDVPEISELMRRGFLWANKLI